MSDSSYPISSGQAFISSKNLSSELISLYPSALIHLYEIDVSTIGFNVGAISQTEVSLGINTIFRFHNNINLTTQSIFWGGWEYVPCPIIAEGFETNLKGSPVTPTLSITVSDIGIPQLTILKQRIRSLGNDLVGAKIIRIRTFARFLDSINFANQIPPAGFFPDPTCELPRDIYYVDRLANENRNMMSYELSPLFEVEGIQLPGRIIAEDNCVFFYRGEGCLYEYSGRQTYVHNGGTLPQYAPPVADSSDELISTLISGSLNDKGAYNTNQQYNMGDSVYIQNRGIKYYFVSKTNGNNTVPPNNYSWIEDQCSKKVLGCSRRWQNINSGHLPFGGFVSVNRFS